MAPLRLFSRLSLNSCLRIRSAGIRAPDGRGGGGSDDADADADADRPDGGSPGTGDPGAGVRGGGGRKNDTDLGLVRFRAARGDEEGISPTGAPCCPASSASISGRAGRPEKEEAAAPLLLLRDGKGGASGRSAPGTGK